MTEPTGPLANDLPIVGNANLKPPKGAENDGRVPGTPTIPMSARSVVIYTARDNNNKKLKHVCGFIDEMQKNIYLKKFIKATADYIREGIRKILEAIGASDPSGVFASITAKLKDVARWLKKVQKFLKDIIDFERYVLGFIAKVRAFIAWIKALPERFLQLLSECLSKFLRMVGSVLTDFFKELGGPGSEFGEFITAAKEVVTETVKTVELAGQAAAGAVAVVGAAATVFTAPASAADLREADKVITTYVASLPTPESIAQSAAPKPLKTSTP